MVRVLAIVAVVGATAGVVIGALQSHPPDLVTAQRNFDSDLQHCLAGDFISEDQLPPGETLDTFCADNVRLENYMNHSMRLSELPNFLKGTSFILIVLGLVIGASSVGADWQAGTMAALLTWEPRRVRIFLVEARSSSGRSSCSRWPCSACSRWSSPPPRQSAGPPWVPAARGCGASRASCGSAASAFGASSRHLAMVGRKRRPRWASCSGTSRSWRASCEDSSRRSPPPSSARTSWSSSTVEPDAPRPGA